MYFCLEKFPPEKRNSPPRQYQVSAGARQMCTAWFLLGCTGATGGSLLPGSVVTVFAQQLLPVQSRPQGEGGPGAASSRRITDLDIANLASSFQI